MKSVFYRFLPQHPTLLGVFDHDNECFRQRVGIDRSPNSYRIMLRARRYVADFLHERYGCSDVRLDRLNIQFIQDYYSYLTVSRRLQSGTSWLACSLLKGVVKRAHERGQMPTNPFVAFHAKRSIRARVYLTEEEIFRLRTHVFSDWHLGYARDIYIFSCFTALSFIDIKELTTSDIVEIDGAPWIVSVRHKTKVPFQVKLLSVPLQIIERYRQLRTDRHVFAHCEYFTMEKRLRRVMSACGIQKRATLHTARHTFATLALTKGMPIESVSRILGHTNIRTTQIYAKITMQKLNDDMTRFGEELALH